MPAMSVVKETILFDYELDEFVDVFPTSDK